MKTPKNLRYRRRRTRLFFKQCCRQAWLTLSFAIRLKGAKQAEAQAFSGLELRTIGNQEYVEFRVPAGDLPADDYTVDVFAEPATSHPMEHFVVRIVRASTPHN